MMIRRLTQAFCLLLAVVFLAPSAAAQSQTGTVEGKVIDQQGAVLPGATVTLTGPRGTQTAVTDQDGVFRFVGLQPDTYTVKTEMSGFVAQESQALVGIGRTVTADFSLKLSTLSESVEVTGALSAVDVRSSATGTSVSSDLLTLMPIYSSTSTGLLNYAPGINSSSAYGAQGSYGNALLMDGVDTRDPEGGSAWTFFNQNLVQEIQIGGLGAPAEYGGFTGAIINTITKSGTNAYSGLFSMRYTNDSLASNNVTQRFLTLNPTLGDAAIVKKLVDYTVQLGGPIKRDKAFFFGSVQRYSQNQDPAGPVTKQTDISPRFNVKVTLQPTATDTLILGTQYDNYNLTGRVGYWPVSQAGDNQTVTEDAPEWVWNAQYRKIFGANNLLEAKFTGYWGYYDLNPVDQSIFTFDGESGEYSGGGGGQYYADRTRNQLQVSFTKYANKFGRHSLKFGAEIERSHVRSQYQPYGPAGVYIYAYGGVPYYGVSYGYDVQGNNRRTSAYVQDQWQAGRVTLNIGLRLDHLSGFSPVLDQTVYKPNNSWGPRVGVAYDLNGKGTSAIKAFWGRYVEGAASAFYTQATPGVQDYSHLEILPNGGFGPPEVVIPGIVYGISNDISHPSTDEFNLSFETQLTRTLRFSATGIWRRSENFINNVINGSLWAPVTLTNQLTNTTFTGYRWANSAATNDDFFIRNTEGFQYVSTDGSVIATADPRRSYNGLMLQLSSSLKNRFGYQVSYVLSKAEGNVDNSGFGAYLQGTTWNSPNTAIINNFGELTNSRTHEVKAYVSYQVPRVDVLLGLNYTGLSGRTFTPFQQYTSSQLNLPSPSSRRQILLEPRGSRRNDFFNQVDLRAEKAFRIEGNRFGIYADIINLFNSDAVLTRQARVPSTTISGETVNFLAPLTIQGARQVTFGARWGF